MKMTMTTSEGLPLGPRRDEVAKLERDIQLHEANVDLALDTGIRDPVWYEVATSALRAARALRDFYLVCSIHQIPGAVEKLRVADVQSRIQEANSDG